MIVAVQIVHYFKNTGADVRGRWASSCFQPRCMTAVPTDTGKYLKKETKFAMTNPSEFPRLVEKKKRLSPLKSIAYNDEDEDDDEC